MKRRLLSLACLSFPFASASALAMLFAASAAIAATYHWDADGNTAGFGTVTGTWGTDAFWTTVAGGGATHSAVSATVPADIVNFGTATLNYGNAAVGVAAGGVTATSIVIGAGQTTALTVGAAGGGTITLGGATRTIQANSHGHSILSPIALTGAATVNLNAPGGTDITTRALTLGALSGTGGLTLQNIAGGNPAPATFILNGASTYTGATRLHSSTTNASVQLTLGVADALPSTTVLTIDGGNGAGSGRVITLSMNGRHQTLAGLIGTSNGTSDASTARSNRVLNSSGTLSILTINGSSASTYAGLIGNGGANIRLVKDGTGTFTLSGVTAFGSNSYTGGTILNQGTLTVTNNGTTTSGTLGAATGALTVNNTNTGAGTNAILNLPAAVDTTTGRLSGTISTPSSGTNTATINIPVSRTLTVNQTAGGTFAGVLSGAGNLTLGSLSTSTLTLAGTNTYTGATTVSAGILAIASTGSLVNTAISATGTGTFAVTPGAGTVNLGNTGTAGAGASLNLGSGSSFSMVDGAAGGLVNLVQEATFIGSALTLDGASLNFELGATVDKLAVTGVATLSGINSINIAAVAGLTAGTYEVLTAAAGLDAGGGFVFGGTGATTQTVALGTSLYLLTLNTTAGAASVTVAAPTTISGLTWTGQNNGNGTSNSSWNNGGSSNWAADSVACVYSNGTAVNFGDTNAADGGASLFNPNVTIAAGGVAPTSATFNNSAVNYTVSGGSISGAGALAKSGTGTLTLANASNFSGGLNLAAGTVILGNATAAGTGAITIATGGATDATVQLGSALTIANPIIISAGSIGTNTLGQTANNTAAFTGPFTVNENLTVKSDITTTNTTLTVFGGGATVASGKSITLINTAGGACSANGVLSGTGGLIAAGTGAGYVNLLGASTYTGGFTLSSGNLIISSSSTGADGNPTDGPFGAGTTPAVLNTGTIRSTTGADHTIRNAISLAGDLTFPTVTTEKNLTFTGPVTLTSNRILTVNTGTNVAGKSIQFTGTIGDSSSGYGITKAGTGTLVLAGLNTYGGVTTISAGTLIVGVADNLGAAAANLVFDGGTLQVTGTTLTSLVGLGRTNPVVFTTDKTVGLNIADAANTFTVGQVLSQGTGGFTKSGAGTAILDQANTYSGPTTISAGTLQISAPGNLGDGSATNTITLGGATLRSTAGTYDLGLNRAITLSANATITADADTLTLSGPITNGASVLTFRGPGNVIVNGVIGTGATPTGGLTIGATTGNRVNVTLSGDNLFTGNVSLPANNSSPSSVLTLTNSGALGVGPKTVASQGGGEIHLQNNITIAVGINFTTSGSSQQSGVNTANRAVIYNDSGNNTINGNITMSSGNGSTIISATSGLLTINGSMTANATGRQLQLRGDGNGLIAGVISNGTTASLPVLKDAGTGTWTLTNVNTYTGPTTISAGTLALGASGSIATSASLTLGAAGTLDTSAQPTYTLPAGKLVNFALNPTGPGTSGKITAAGLDISTAVATLSPTATLDDPVYILATYTSLTGSAFAAPLPTVPGYTLNYAYEGNKIALVQNPGFSGWIAGTFAGGASVPLDKRGPNDDPDNDGIRNLLEYAIAGQDPTVGNPNIGSFDGTTLSFDKRQPLATDITYAIQDSTDLGLPDVWAEVPAGPSYTNNATTISFTLIPGTPPRNFLRLQVITN